MLRLTYHGFIHFETDFKINSRWKHMENGINFKSVFDSEAGKILGWAFLLFFILLALIGYAFSVDIVLGRTLLGAFVASALGGRAAGVGLCIAFDMNIFTTILYNIFIEVLVVCFSYAFFLLSINHYLHFRWLKKAIINAENNALKYSNVISRYGWIGIFMFVMIPLPVTGPVVGSIIAYFMNFNLKKNFFTVFSGTLVAIIVWSVFFDFISDHLTKIQGLLGVILIVVFVYFSKHIKNWFSRDGLVLPRDPENKKKQN